MSKWRVRLWRYLALSTSVAAMGCKGASETSAPPNRDVIVETEAVSATDPLCVLAATGPSKRTFTRGLGDSLGLGLDALPDDWLEAGNMRLASTRCEGVSLLEVLLRHHSARALEEVLRRSVLSVTRSGAEHPLITTLRGFVSEKPGDAADVAAIRACLRLRFAAYRAEEDDAKAFMSGSLACEAAGLPHIMKIDGERDAGGVPR